MARRTPRRSPAFSLSASASGVPSMVSSAVTALRRARARLAALPSRTTALGASSRRFLIAACASKASRRRSSSARWVSSAAMYFGCVHTPPAGGVTRARMRSRFPGSPGAARPGRGRPSAGSRAALPAQSRARTGRRRRTTPSATPSGPPPSAWATRTEGTVPSHGGRGRSLNQQAATPCRRIGAVRASISVRCGRRWASSVILQEPSGADASTSARQDPSGARTSNWRGCSRRERLSRVPAEEVVSLRFPLARELAVRSVRGMGEESHPRPGGLRIHWVPTWRRRSARWLDLRDRFSPACPQPRSGRRAKRFPGPRAWRGRDRPPSDDTSNVRTVVSVSSGGRAKGGPSRVSDRQVTEQARAVNAGREGTPVLEHSQRDGTTEAGSLIDETSGRAPGGCWPPRWRRRWTRT